MIKQIAVLMSAINLGNQNKIMEGIIDAAKENDCNLFVFTCYINYSEKEENKRGAYQIMTLPDFSYFDGVILAQNTIQHEATAEQVLASLKESGVPVVSIDVRLPGMNYIGISNYDAQYEIVEHLIREHQCARLCYIAGPPLSEAATERRRAFEDAMEKHHLDCSDDQILVGYWNERGAKSTVEDFLCHHQCPEAFVCANDQMAIGVMQALQNKGYRVPEDVLVTGFDNEELSELCIPPLTSVEGNQYRIGREALLMLLGEEAKKNDRALVVPTSLTLRESCGCEMEDRSDTKRFRGRYVQDRLRAHYVSDTMKNMQSDFSGREQPEELIDALKKYVAQTHMDQFYLCLCDREKLFGVRQEDLSEQLDIRNINTTYTENVEIPLAYEEGVFRTYGPFPSGMVLPEICRNRSGGNFYIVNPIYYQSLCYGYSICGNSRVPFEDGLHYLWLMNIGIGLENIRKWRLLKDTMLQLNQMWVYDMLTHLYNRAGFFHFADAMLAEMQENGEEAFLLFIDIDGLKAVNDSLGHEIGDRLITSMAELIRKSVSENELAMRYGGDEFVVFGAAGEDRLDRLMEKLKEGMDARNGSNTDFQLSASMGGSRVLAEEIDNLNHLIEQADKCMYVAKREKKRRDR